jgi:hypothetical protein
MSDEAVFDNLPKYDPTKFQAPAWATGPAFDFTRKNGESSKSAHSASPVDVNHSTKSAHDLDDPESDDDDEEIWEDAQDELARDELEAGIEESPDGLVFTVSELQVCLPPSSLRKLYCLAELTCQKLVDRAQVVKNEGNAAFTSKPPKTELAIEKYESALKLLPPVPKLEPPTVKSPPVQVGGSGIQEITDEEADAITQAEKKVMTEREEVEGKIRECAKACHGNLAACWALMKEDKKAVEASNKGESTFCAGRERRNGADL